MAGLMSANAAAQVPQPNDRTVIYTRESLGVRPAGFPDHRPDAGVLQAAAQGGRRPYDEDAIDLQIQIDPPDPARLFERDSESSWRKRIVEESRRKMGGPRIVFPDYRPVTREPFMVRQFPPLTELVEPAYVLHRRLLFEQPNLERYGWDLGILTPGVSMLGYYKDLVLLPYHLGTRPFQHYDTSAGKCLPGDPTPFLIYPPELSLSGLVTQAGVVTAGFFVFP